MQVIFVKNVNFFRFKVAELQTFILGQINLQIFLKLRIPFDSSIKQGVPCFQFWSNKFANFFF